MNHLWKCLCVALAFIAAFMITGCSGERESAVPGVLVSTDWLQNHLDDPNVVILHSGSAEVFDSLHPDSIVDLLRSMGVDNDSRIVLYYENSKLIPRTARVYVTLDKVGLGNRTFVLNGGLPAWQEEERKTTDMVPDISCGNLWPGNSKEVVIQIAELDRQRWSADFVVIDTRSEKEYYGTPGTGDSQAEGGHIEGAHFLPYQAILTDEKPYLFKSDPELNKMFRDAGMAPEKMNVVYCGSGIRASVCYLAARHLEYPTLLYDGSYEEWEKLNMPLTGPVVLPGKDANLFAEKLASAALLLTQQEVVYDPGYYAIDYPNGDVPADRGVCSDVLIRAYRLMGIDLQREVHEDMVAHFELYPDIWGLSRPDTNIDHRRVPNLMMYFERHGTEKAITGSAADYLPGDIVCWNLGGAVTHIGIVVNSRSRDGSRPLVVHNIGRGQVVEDCLFDFRIIGHYIYQANN